MNIIGKRDDGYHNLETVFYPLPFYDVLEIVHGTQSSTEIFLSGIKIEGGDDNNLCLKAYDLLKNDFPQLSAIKIYLRKNIFIGAGLGGGSADGAFMLKLLNDKFNLNISEERLLQYALMLGSDCAFFILNKPCFAQQRGEKLEPIALDLSAYKLVLINPNIHINTGWAFKQIQPSSPAKNIKVIIQQPVDTWKDELHNDFEAAVFAAHPSIQKIKNDLYDAGAVYASMSGSGSSVFGIFNKAIYVNIERWKDDFNVIQLSL